MLQRPDGRTSSTDITGTPRPPASLLAALLVVSPAAGMAAEFVHLHVHSQYSFLTSAVKLSDLPGKAKALGMRASR